VHLSIFILVINQLDAQNLFYNNFISCLNMFQAQRAHHQTSKIVLYSLWYHHTYRWPSRAETQPVHGTATYRCDDARGCIIQFLASWWWAHCARMCSKHVEAWNKVIAKQILCIKLVNYEDKYYLPLFWPTFEQATSDCSVNVDDTNIWEITSFSGTQPWGSLIYTTRRLRVVEIPNHAHAQNFGYYSPIVRERNNCCVEPGPVRWVTWWMGQEAMQPAVPDRTWYRLLGSVQMCAHRKQKADWFLHNGRKYSVTKIDGWLRRETMVIQKKLPWIFLSIYTPNSTREIQVKFLKHAQLSTL